MHLLWRLSQTVGRAAVQFGRGKMDSHVIPPGLCAEDRAGRGTKWPPWEEIPIVPVYEIWGGGAWPVRSPGYKDACDCQQTGCQSIFAGVWGTAEDKG